MFRDTDFSKLYIIMLGISIIIHFTPSFFFWSAWQSILCWYTETYKDIARGAWESQAEM